VKRPVQVLEALARRYERRLAGRTGEASRDVLVDIEELLSEAEAAEGDARAVAEQALRDAERAGILKLEPLHKRDRSSLHQVRFSPANEARLYEALRQQSPKSLRGALAEQFTAAATQDLPERWRSSWQRWCERMRAAALSGNSVEPFSRRPGAENAELLTLLPKLLAWEGESLVRFTSCLLCGDSKRLESLAAKEKEGEFRDKLRGKLGRLLEEITGGQIHALDDIGILPNPRFALVHGPLKLRLDGEWLDLGKLEGAFRLAELDIKRAQEIVTAAKRCLTVENETSFHELAKLQSGEALVQTSYPGSGTLALLKRLPAEMEFWHFGDSDEAGFDILRVLGEKSGRNFQPLHMRRGQMPFEQESLGRPSRKQWPFYG
jgi:Wadjet protein JetD, C-terminal